MSASATDIVKSLKSSDVSAECAWCRMGISLSAGHVLVENNGHNFHEEPCFRNLSNYQAMVKRVNAMDGDEIDELIKADRCPFEPEHLVPMPLGMFHCDLCGEMVVAGLPHGRNS